MFTSHTKSTGSSDDQPRINWRAVSDFAGDLIGVISIFVGGYVFLLIGHGFGLN